MASVTYENERISIRKKQPPYIKCMLRLSCVVHGPIYGHFVGCTVNDLYIERKPFTVQPIKRPQIGPRTTQEDVTHILLKSGVENDNFLA